MTTRTKRAHMRLPGDLQARVSTHLKARDEKLRARAARPVKIRDAADDTAELYIYDEIGFWGVMAADVAETLAQIDASRILVRINSPGGDVFDGLAIYNLLLDHDADIDVVVDGVAASAASYIAMAGDTVTANSGAQFMIHDAWGLTVGDAADMRDMADVLDQISDTIAGIYAERAGGDAEDWRTVMRDEKWYTAQAAVDAGLADEVVTRGARGGDPEDEPEDEPADDSAAAKTNQRRARALVMRADLLAARYRDLR